MNYYFTPSRAWLVEHCDERVFVCMLCLSVRKGISRTSGSNFTKLSVHIGSALSRSCSTGVAISYVLLVLSMTLLLHILVWNRWRERRILNVILQVAARIWHRSVYSDRLTGRQHETWGRVSLVKALLSLHCVTWIQLNISTRVESAVAWLAILLFVDAGEEMLKAAQAGDVDLLQHLLDTGHSINETNYDCVTPLHEACLAGRLECVQFLLLCGANVSLSISSNFIL